MSKDTHPPGLIPDQLLSNIKKGDCVLFLGADLPLGYEGAPLSRPELAAALAAKHGLPADQSWPKTAQAYLSKYSGDRRGLIDFVAERCSGPKVKPGPLHQAIARAGFRAIVTAWYDEKLEMALHDAGYRVNRVVNDKQVPYAREGEREATVIKLYGCLSDYDSLVLTHWDCAELMVRLSQKLKLVIAFCSMRPPLFVSFDLANDMPIQLYTYASTDMVEHMQRVYAVWPYALDDMQAGWQEKNFEFIQAGAAAFLETLAGQLPSVGPAARRAIHVNRPPYKFLDYYEADDADIFCGRDTESQIVTRLALSHRLLTLFGPSGAGKTSLLLGGVVPRLTAEKYQYVYVRALDDPLVAVRKAVAERAGRSDWEIGDDLRAFLTAVLAKENRLVVVLDQFEELFIRVGEDSRATFFDELARALTQPVRDARFIFSLREDYLAYLDEARDYLPDIFGNSFRLATLDQANARVAITEPAARAGVTVETGLVDVLVGSEGREAGDPQTGDLIEAGGRVPPAALQIVLNYVYVKSLPEGHSPGDPPPPNLILTLERYRAARRRLGEGEKGQELTGAQAILAGYVHEGIADLPEARQREMGRKILKVMVTSQATKAALTHAEIVGLLDEAADIQGDNPRHLVLVEDTRLGLERVRLLRGFERDGVALYELAHDHLAAEIAAWISEEEMGAKLARELLRREMDNWRGAKLLIRPEVLALIHERREELKRLNADELELLFRSALAAGHETVYWFKRAREGGVNVDEIALAGLQGENFRTRAAAVTTLGELGERFAGSLAEVLKDDYPQVRAAAIHALEQLRPDGAWRERLVYECYVPAGPFIMGDDDSNQSDEKPAHEVTLDAFYIAKYPVTNAEYERYMDDVGRPFDIPEGKADHPVVNVSLYDARDYAAWAGIRLLTEAEWEKAASWDEGRGNREGKEWFVGRLVGGEEWFVGVGRLVGGEEGRLAGRKRKYPWGDEFDKRKCNTKKSDIGATTPVGKYSPDGDSPCGCADMAGNVREWTSSLNEPYPYQVDDGREDPSSPASRVLRGGSFLNYQGYARCAYRYRDDPDYRYYDIGFRVVCAIRSSEIVPQGHEG